MTKQTSTPGYYTLPELADKDLDSFKYPIHVAKVMSPHIVLLYAEGKHLAMSDLAPGSVDFDAVKQFCMMSRQEEQLLYNFCKTHNVNILCEVRAPEYNFTRWQDASIVPVFVLSNDDLYKPNPTLMVTLSSTYGHVSEGRRIGYNSRTVTDAISLRVAIDLAERETNSPGIIIVDSDGGMFRADSAEWECRNRLLRDLSGDLREGRFRRLTYPRVDEREEYYRDCVMKVLNERPYLREAVQEGRTPLWTVLSTVEEWYGNYETHKIMEEIYPDA